MKLNAKTIVGIALSGLLLWWALHDVDFSEVMQRIRNADPLLFILSIALATAGLAIRAVRWSSLLYPAGRGVPFRPRYAATCIGFGANNVLPARVGEFARALSLTRLTGLPAGVAFGSLVLERIFDGVALIGLLFASMAAPSFPAGGGFAEQRRWAILVGAVMAAGLAFLFLVAIRPDRAIRLAEKVLAPILPERLRSRFLEGMRSFIGGLGALRDPRLFLGGIAWALAQWTFLAVSYLAAFRAFDIHEVPLAGAIFLQSLISLAVALPSAPGFFGPYEVAARFGLAVWGVPEAKAISFAIGFHIGAFIPVTLLGFYYAWRMNLRWSDVERSEERVEEATAEAVRPARPGGA